MGLQQFNALLTEFKTKREALRREWAAAVGTSAYVKVPWFDRYNALVDEYRDKLTVIGYPPTKIVQAIIPHWHVDPDDDVPSDELRIRFVVLMAKHDKLATEYAVQAAELIELQEERDTLRARVSELQDELQEMLCR